MELLACIHGVIIYTRPFEHQLGYTDYLLTQVMKRNFHAYASTCLKYVESVTSERAPAWFEFLVSSPTPVKD